jgi:isochorismate hydrolase
MKKTILSFLLAAVTSVTSYAGDIAEEFTRAISPSAPKLFDVETAASETALLILDTEEQRSERNRRSKNNGKTAPISALINKAEESGITVIYNIRNGHSAQRTITEAGNNDQRIYAELEGILKQHNIKNIIIAGVADNGAVLHTATAASYMGYKIIAPVDCLSASESHTEQATVWNLASGAEENMAATLTKSDMIKIRI